MAFVVKSVYTLWKGRRIELVGWSNSDYGGDLDDRKSTSGAISWSSKKQPIVTFSTTEDEFIVATSSACQGVWLKRINSEPTWKLIKGTALS